ncbi:MAG: FAD-dependent oxidoreductase, partial [Spirochaetota bacterium]
VQYLLKKNNVPVIQGTGRITGRNEVTINHEQKVSGKYILIATGSSPRIIPGFEFDESLILSSNGALMLEKVPAKLLIIGGGAIGCEFAHIMNAFGVEVHLVEMLDHILPFEDRETAAALADSFKRRGISVYAKTKVTSVAKKVSSVTAAIEGEGAQTRTLEVDKVLVVVGRTPNISGIGLEETGVKTEKGFISTGDYYKTSVENIFAIGDVVNSPLLAHVASKEGEIAVEYMAGKKPVPRIDAAAIPAAVYTEPQVASFGLTEKKAEEAGINFKKAVFPYRGAGKSVAIERSEGFVKIIYHGDTKEILGAHVVGVDATEIIHEILLAKTAELLPEDIANMIHAHPTISEAVMESMRLAEGRAIHI